MSSRGSVFFEAETATWILYSFYKPNVLASCCADTWFSPPPCLYVVAPSSRPHGRQVSLSSTASQSLFKLMPVEWVMLSNHLFPCRPLLLLPLWLSDVCKLRMRPGHGAFAPYPIQSQGTRPPLSTGPLAEPWGRLALEGGGGVCSGRVEARMVLRSSVPQSWAGLPAPGRFSEYLQGQLKPISFKKNY